MTDSIARKVAKHLHKKTVAFTAEFFKRHADYVKIQETTELSPKAKELKRLIEENEVNFGCQQDSVVKVLETLLGEKLGISEESDSSDGPWFDTDGSKPGLIYKNLDSNNDIRVGALLMTISNDADDVIDETGTENYGGITYALNKFAVPTVDEIEAFVKSITIEKLGEYIVIV